MVQYTQVAKRLAQHVCVFGDPKSGKSTLVSKLAEAGYKLIWISCDGGHTILDKLSPAAQARVNLIAISDTKDNPIAIHTVTKLTDGGLRHICDMHGQLNCAPCTAAKRDFTDVNLSAAGPDTIVVIDPGSQVVESAINAIVQKEAKSVDARDSYKLDYGDWATLGSMMSRILSNVQTAKYHCVLIAHSAETEMEDSSKRLVPLLGTVPFSRNSGKYFDHIVYCTVRMNAHKIGSRTTFMNNVVTGSRTDVAIEDGKELTMLNFFGPPRKLEASEVMTTAAAEVDKVETVATMKEVEDALGATGNVSALSPSGIETAQSASEVKNDAKDALAKLRASMLGKK